MLVFVLSLDTKRVRLVTIGNEMVVEKQTTRKEREQIAMANSHLRDNPIQIPQHSLTVNTVPIVGWSDEKSLLTTTYCYGINGEVALRESSGCQRLNWLSLFRWLLLAMRDKGFLWGDCAPRNMIVDFEGNHLWLVDFERDIRLTHGAVGRQEFSRHIRSYAREEFSSFLLADEQQWFFSGIIEEREDKPILLLSEVGSKRKTSLLIARFGRRETYSAEELRQVEDMMAFIATPFKINGRVFFPMYTIDRVSNEKGVETYASIAIKLHAAGSCEERFQLLKDMATTD